jgi:purine-binding chemotaxis protein CheW
LALRYDQEDTLQLVGFRLGSKLFGADILNVREILRDPRIDVVDGLPDFILGVAQIRGQVLPIVNLKHILGMPSTPMEDEKKWVLVAHAGKRSIGYIVDAVTPIIRIKKDSVLPAPDLILYGLRSKYIQGVCESDKGLIIIVKMEHMLADDEVHAMDRAAIR